MSANSPPVISNDPKPRRFSAGDIWGGLAAAAVVLPQAMAFGVALLVPYGFDASMGARAGLIGAGALSLSAGILGGTRGLISAPTGPVLVLLTGTLASLTAAGLNGAQLLFALAATLALTGVFEGLIGATGGGRLIKFIPYPVVAGFMTGSAALMISSQLTPLAGSDASGEWRDWSWLPLLSAAVTFILITYVPRIISSIPGTIAGLIGGTLFFHAISTIGPGPIPDTWVIGTLPRPSGSTVVWSLEIFNSIPWRLVIPASLALAVLASLDTLLTSVIADVGTGMRHKARTELLGQGIGQTIAALFGGMAGAGTTGATLVAIKSGGRRWTGAIAGLAFIGFAWGGGIIGTYLPIGVLAGVIVHVAVSMIEWDILSWLKHRLTLADAGIAILVTIVTISYDLMVAVGVGVAIAITLFIREQVRAPVIHQRSIGKDLRSTRSRPQSEYESLDKHGDRIVLYELRGNLFFGTVDRLFEELLGDLDRAAWVILHLRRVNRMDLTGLRLLQQIAARLHRHQGQLIFCHVHKAMGIGDQIRETLSAITSGATDAGPDVLTFNGSDEALEYAEDSLLKDLGSPAILRTTQISIAETDICRDMSAAEVETLMAAVRNVSIEQNDTIFAAGDHGDELYIVASGEIDVRLPTTEHHYKRLAKYGPGTFFGEVAFFEPGPRTANAVAVYASKLYVLDRPGFDQLTKRHPHAAQTLLFALARMQGLYLRWTASQLRRLEQW